MIDPRKPLGSAPPHSASSSTSPAPATLSSAPGNQSYLLRSFTKNTPIQFGQSTLPIFSADYPYTSLQWNTWSPQEIAKYLGVIIHPKKSKDSYYFELPKDDFWSRRMPLNHTTGLPAFVRQFISNADDKVINNLNRLFMHVMHEIQSKWPRLPYFLQIYTARWLCKNREEDLNHRHSLKQKIPNYDNNKEVLPSYPQLLEKFKADPLLKSNKLGNKLNSSLQTPPVFFDRMQIEQQHHPTQTPLFFDITYNQVYPLECIVAIPVEINNIIFTVWHTKIFSTDLTCLTAALIHEHCSKDREVIIMEAHILVH